jgi:hypothetical protein
MRDFEDDILDSGKNSNYTSIKKTEDMLWVNKYRPRTLEHFCLEPQLKKKFESWIEKDDIQSCCLIGGPGIGKTTLALILANSSKDNDILFIPCAIEGKVETIQSKIVPFCQAASRGRKFVILDELDSASATQANSFQKALRNVIEQFPDEGLTIADVYSIMGLPERIRSTDRDWGWTSMRGIDLICVDQAKDLWIIDMPMARSL